VKATTQKTLNCLNENYKLSFLLFEKIFEFPAAKLEVEKNQNLH